MSEWVIPALGVALSPLPLLAMLLVLGGRRPVAHGAAFWAAWTIGVAAATIAFVLLAEVSGATDDDPRAIAVAEIAIGALFLVFAARLVLSGRGERSDAVPSWLQALDRSGGRRAALIGLVLSGANPKNLALTLAAAIAIAEAHERERDLTLAAVGFVLVAVSAVSLLLAGYAAFSSRFRRIVSALRKAIARHDRTIAVVLGAVIGAFFLLDGLRSL
jgi:threonine/homoserine/homoserine lactone efflux protein